MAEADLLCIKWCRCGMPIESVCWFVVALALFWFAFDNTYFFFIFFIGCRTVE